MDIFFRKFEKKKLRDVENFFIFEDKNIIMIFLFFQIIDFNLYVLENIKKYFFDLKKKFLYFS